MLQVPFTLNCGFPVPVTFRWVTTTIARYDQQQMIEGVFGSGHEPTPPWYPFRMDPVGSWPTDLKCNFELNKQLKTYDGALCDTSSSLLLFPWL